MDGAYNLKMIFVTRSEHRDDNEFLIPNEKTAKDIVGIRVSGDPYRNTSRTFTLLIPHQQCMLTIFISMHFLLLKNVC